MFQVFPVFQVLQTYEIFYASFILCDVYKIFYPKLLSLPIILIVSELFQTTILG